MDKFLIIFHLKKNFNTYAHYLHKLIKMRIRQHFRLPHFIGMLFRKLRYLKNLVGISIQYYGRYQKRLRNQKKWLLKGRLTTSANYTPHSYHNFIILLKEGVCGLKISLLMKSTINAIF